MQHHIDDHGAFEATGTLRFDDIEGGIWTLVLDESHDELGEAVVLQSLPDGADIGDGLRVRARVRVADAQFGIAMAGTYVDVLELEPTGA